MFPVKGAASSPTSRSDPIRNPYRVDDVDEAHAVLLLQEELASARAEQAEALRRANRLHESGDYPELQAAMRDVDHQHSTVCKLQGELRLRLERARCLDQQLPRMPTR